MNPLWVDRACYQYYINNLSGGVTEEKNEEDDKFFEEHGTTSDLVK